MIFFCFIFQTFCARTVAPGDASASELLYEAFRGDFDVAAHLGMAYVAFSVRAEVIKATNV
jgi:hypothetical protein